MFKEGASMYDLIIVGCGPAGMSAALYAGRANKSVLILDGKSYGGQIINASLVENYPGIDNISGFDFATNLFNQIKKLGIEIKFERVIQVKRNEVITDNNNYSTKSIILATGCSYRKIGIKDEDKYLGKGLSYCATCDGNFYRDKVVAVIGGGNTALEDAIYLSNIAKCVYLIHRRDIFRGEDKYLEYIKSLSNVELILNSQLLEIIGNDVITGIKVKNNDGSIKLLDIDGLFIAIGQVPNSQCFSKNIEIDKDGYIISSDGVHTNIDGIYVAGDVRVKDLRQLTTAISDGAISATVAIKEMEDIYGK